MAARIIVRLALSSVMLPRSQTLAQLHIILPHNWQVRD